MKKMKRIVSFESPYAVCEDKRSKYRHQCLLQDYEELERETEVMRRKLQILKQKKLMLSTEVRFCRQRCRYLMRNPSSKLQPRQDVSPLHNPKIQASIVSKNRKYSRKETSLQSRIASRSYAKERVSDGVEGKSQKPARVFDLNQNARSLTGKDAFFINSSAQLFDLNQNDRIHSGKDLTKKSISLFDLNQISVEEEELMGDIENMKSEEPKRSARKGACNEEHGDIKLSGCRSMGNGSNRTRKRKISWQDQVALRV
ncbi:uncharacterized protein LOC114749636 [Neltuma alba]|uniref:uncharacterized protein LOC114749636 n=1 Tax=Neltuma alba TaxID=207710 RepID=UPI0010A30195|nr:uncharacterized protein LOC114749636 [Prosopis alba]XP_028794004.1 uncharacterized protein LOC114749636 [Prosopis alba]